MRKSLRFLFLIMALFTGLQLSAQNDYPYYDKTPTYNETVHVWEYEPESQPAWITTVNSDEWHRDDANGVAVGPNGDFFFGSGTYGDNNANSGHVRGTVTSPNFDTNTPLTLELDFTQSNQGGGNDKNTVNIEFLVTYKDLYGNEKKNKITIKLILNRSSFTIKEYSWVNEEWVDASLSTTGEHNSSNSSKYTFVIPLPSDYGSNGHTLISIEAGGGLYIGTGSQGGSGNTIDIYGDNLVLRDDWDNTERLRRNAGKKMKKVTIVRSYDKGWYTLCLPFNLTMKQFQRRFMASFEKDLADTYDWTDGSCAEIWEYTGFSNNIMQFTKSYGNTGDANVLSAAVPYLIYVPESIERTLVDFTAPAYIGAVSEDVQPGEKVMVFTNITLADEATLFGTANVVEKETGYKFVSNLSKTNLADENANVMADYQVYYLHTDTDGENPKLYKPNDTSTNIKGFRAYFTSPKEGSGTNPSALSFDNSMTSVGAVELPSTADGRVYNLQGQLVNKALNELPRGIYIVNHKKYVVK